VIDPDVPIRFLLTAYEPDDWVAVLLKSYETDETTQRVGPLAFVSDTRFQAWLRWRNLQHHNVYVSVNALAPNQQARTREAVRAVRHVFLDIDQDASAVLTRLSARHDLPTPSYLLRTSPNRVHVLWQASGFTTGAVEALQTHLARDLGTDRAATPCTQMTRLPGFVNYKRRPHLVTVEYGDVIRRFTPADFPPVTAAIAPPVTIRRRRHGALRVALRERARRYLAALPPAIAGHHGDLHTFRVCCRLTRGFALSDDEALPLLAAWNARCVPPWSARELLDKLRRARRYGREPVGGLIDARG
jgi:gluconate kinase